MERPAYPFPLAANSSHHSHYHRFLLGAGAQVLEPLPRPWCTGALAGLFPELTGHLDLARWRKLYCASVPWVEGFGPEHYGLGNVPAYRPLPREYCRPLRKFAAFDFVQIADPSVSALALVAGDRRVIVRFRGLCEAAAGRIETGAQSRSPGAGGGRVTGRILAGNFMEPNSRWLMPLLHVHSRVLNLTSFADSARRLHCMDSSGLGRAAERAKREWLRDQAEALGELGYRAYPKGASLRVDGVSERLLTAIDAPRIAVLRLLGTMVCGDRGPSAERLTGEFPIPVIAAMVEQLEEAAVRSVRLHRPPKISLPSEGPWRGAVRAHLRRGCRAELEALDAAAFRAGAPREAWACIPSSADDAGHFHAPTASVLKAANQQPTDPELGAAGEGRIAVFPTSRWLALQFERCFAEVCEKIATRNPDDPLLSLRKVLPAIDQISQGAGHDQLCQAEAILGAELERAARQLGSPAWDGPARGLLGRTPSLEEFCETLPLVREPQERELGGRSL